MMPSGRSPSPTAAREGSAWVKRVDSVKAAATHCADDNLEAAKAVVDCDRIGTGAREGVARRVPLDTIEDEKDRPWANARLQTIARASLERRRNMMSKLHKCRVFESEKLEIAQEEVLDKFTLVATYVCDVVGAAIAF